MNLKVAKIEMILTDEHGAEVSKLSRDDKFVWRVEGPIYPKHMKLMATLNDHMREIDVDK